jgi:glycolate oxidase FAD binding subunit
LAFAPVPDAGAKAIRAVVEEVGGTAMLVRAEDRVRTRVDIFEPLGDALRGLSQRLKESFDPMRILNPGRMYAGL